MLSPQSDLSRPSTNADSWGRYYTADWVSESLVTAMHAQQPRLIVELGSGRGALASAARDKWRRAQVVTVDVDHCATAFMDASVAIESGSYRHHVHDALDDDLANRIGLSLGSVDVAVCNPPYVRPRWRKSFGRILEDAGLSGSLKSIHDAGADLLFIAQNLRLLKQHGTLGLILPDGLITAGKFEGVRRALLREHRVEQVVQLPRRVFSGTEAQTYLVVLAKKSGETSTVTLRQISADGVISPPVSVPSDMAQRRLDYSYHVSTRAQRSDHRMRQVLRVGDMTLAITRGTFSSQQIAQCSWPVFHLGDFVAGDPVVPKRFRLSQRALGALPPRTKISMPGDVLVARIGRNLHEKVAIVEHGPCVVSDCVFTLRVRDEARQALLGFLSSQAGRRALDASAHGVGARFLSSSDLMELEVLR
ncbi:MULTISPECIES: N-6 DNA methylase [Paraburkholderia]|uniref:N-6 DNA methylase n=1 Tax=Paraburkholderia TaxID=1822464 RepID=UPI001CB60579|nr:MULTISPECIES: N-6 DNA methylase [Paraburkholderia]CAG9193537.1 Site-specific DNA-methyltransferase (adenine-specific) [Paraburkholderia caribensis]